MRKKAPAYHLLINRCFEIYVRLAYSPSSRIARSTNSHFAKLVTNWSLLALFLAPYSVASEDSAANEFFIREVCKKSGVSFILFLAPYSVASEDSATNEFFIREAHKNSGLTCQFCHVW